MHPCLVLGVEGALHVRPNGVGLSGLVAWDRPIGDIAVDRMDRRWMGRQLLKDSEGSILVFDVIPTKADPTFVLLVLRIQLAMLDRAQGQQLPVVDGLLGASRPFDQVGKLNDCVFVPGATINECLTLCNDGFLGLRV